MTNTGTVDADDVILGFLTPPNAGADGVPLQTLFGFERVFVKVGETVAVHLYPELTQFMYDSFPVARNVSEFTATFLFMRQFYFPGVFFHTAIYI